MIDPHEPAAATALQPGPAHRRNPMVLAVDAARVSSSLPRRAICVRLCDGYFFPVGPLSRKSDLAEQEAVCSGLCPDAPAQLFIEPAGSDTIADAVSASGAPYSSLPMAFSNRISTRKTCSCHRRPGQAFSWANDFTLREGDAIMTSTGFMVFRGTARTPHAQADFDTLASASMPSDKRAVLAEIEHATLPNKEQTLVIAAMTSLHRSRIAFATPSVSRSATGSIRFVDSMTAARD